MAKNTIKLNTTTSDSYRELLKFMLQNNTVYHTFQPKSDKAYMVVIKQMHHPVEPIYIQEELENLGHPGRNIVNANQGTQRNSSVLYGNTRDCCNRPCSCVHFEEAPILQTINAVRITIILTK